MATKRFLGAQVRRNEIQSITITAVNPGDAFTYTLNNKAIVYVPITGDTTATAASGLATAIVNALDGEFRQYTVSIDSTNTSRILLTSITPGRFISADGNTAPTVAAAGTSGISSAIVQAGKSPLDGSDTVNWSGGALPANSGDDWYFENAPAPMQFNLAALSGKSAASLRVLRTFSGAGIGLPYFAPEGYTEYRGGRLALTACTILDLELPETAVAESFRFNVGSAQCTADIRGIGLGAVGSEVVDWVGTHASNAIDVTGASIKIAPYVGDAATVATLNMLNSAATVGTGTTLTTLSTISSTAFVQCAFTTANIREGSILFTQGTGAATTINLDNGSTLVYNSTGTITTLVIGPGCVADFSQTRDALTITNQVQIHTGGILNDPHGRLTLTNGWTTVRCRTNDVTVNLGNNRSYTVA